ncbi:MAG TPA: hypothetical protein VGE90_08870 [Chitinophaga sp.]
MSIQPFKIICVDIQQFIEFENRGPSGYYEGNVPVNTGEQGLNAKGASQLLIKKKKGGKNTALVIILTISYEKPRSKID